MQDTSYVWNFDILKDFLLQGVSHKWLIPIIQGYCMSDHHHTYLKKPLSLTLISRRSTARAGPRFYSRGIDELGNVSNFVETEMILRYNNEATLFSHVQVRGSVPLFWT